MSKIDDELLETRQKSLLLAKGEGKCVIYVMSRDQRIKDNHALLAAQKHAVSRELPLAVVFCLRQQSGNRRREHYQFMIDGLHHVESGLKKLNIPFMMVIGDPIERLSGVLHHTQPDAVFFDFSPLREAIELQEKLLDYVKAGPLVDTTSVSVVDTHNMIPVWTASDKREIGARTMRLKIHKHFSTYLREPATVMVHPHDWPGTVQPLKRLNARIDEVLNDIKPSNISIDTNSGEAAATLKLKKFIKDGLNEYAIARNDPSVDAQSNLSPYLHFGQLSSLRVALELHMVANNSDHELHISMSSKMPKPENTNSIKMAGINTFLEELIVRKELSDNFCYFEEHYDRLEGADGWAKQTIEQHDSDPREHIYTYQELESASTHDEAWNAAQMQLIQTGKMHGYMRMYWAKKLKEWTSDAEQAIKFAIKLNDSYSLDGGDPNGYAGIMWSICGVHDRAWPERDIFGKVRYMNYQGLQRKFNIQEYIDHWLKQ